MIEIFKEIRKIVQQIFQMSVYGVFTYGKNKSGNSQSHLKNVFHTGILSSEFKKLFEMEEYVRSWIKQKRNESEEKWDIIPKPLSLQSI